MDIDDIVLHCTSKICPEQYDALDKNGNVIAYLRLRHGIFTVECPSVDGELVYSAMTEGNGIFGHDERETQLRSAKNAIAVYYNNRVSDKKVKIWMKPSCFTPSMQMEIVIPFDRDTEEYIDELLDSILNEEYRYNCEWEFV